MSKKDAVAAELREIRDMIRDSYTGLTFEQLKKRLSFQVSDKTLKRRISSLLELKEISQEGGQKQRIYINESPVALADMSFMLEDEGARFNEDRSLNLSEESSALLAYFDIPARSRKAAGYNQDFLKSYTPNHTSYLTHQEKQLLATTGVTTHLLEPAGTYARQVLQRLLIDLSWNSSRLEGNTYSLLDTKRLIEQGSMTEGKSLVETTMILNHKDAIEFLVDGEDDIGFNGYTIKNLHAILSNNLLPTAASGRIRSHAVGIAQSTYKPIATPQQLEELFDLMLDKAGAIEDPFERSFFIMVHLPYLQPFDDVNKRVSRLAANIPLFKANLSPLTFVGVPKELYVKGLLAVYERNDTRLLKEVFMWAYRRSADSYAAIRQAVGEPDLFKQQQRAKINEIVRSVVIGAMDQKTASEAIIHAATALGSPKEKERFVEVVSTEILSLHDGNFARYRIRPSEFKAWKENWDRKPE